MTDFDWFTSDLHLGHERINELAHRPFNSVEEMNQAIISNWNNVVRPNDFVCLLGDACMGKIANTLPLLGILNGFIFLSCGNHDRPHPLNNKGLVKRAEWEEKYREYVSLLPLQFSTVVGSEWVECCHFPYTGDSHGEDRYADFRPADNGRWLIHGHVHETWKQRDRMINVSTDVWDFTPVSRHQLASMIEGGF